MANNANGGPTVAQIERNTRENAENSQPVAQETSGTGTLKVEQPREGAEVPDSATIVREYAKWTDNNGAFHKVPIDGTTAIREPAHEQQELTIEERDRVDQSLALVTPRTDEAKAQEAKAKLQAAELPGDEVHQQLKDKPAVEAAPAQEGDVVGPDDHPEFGNNDGNVSDGFKTPGK